MGSSELSLLKMAIMQSWNAVVITSADRAAGYPVKIANPAFCQMTGYAIDELYGQSLKMLQGPATDQEVINRLREGANKRGNSSRLTQSFHFFMFEPIFSPVNALNQPI
ncbi:hypothetical protein [Aeromonas hydrophila]|uniref:hypothetical protein n=1 Tax=Aeromonas hydrophila TaxID=644 RepID=UPI0018D8240D|nr:hypothetical protein [Aeromonas hydrophila]